MKVKAYPEAFINNTNKICISNSNSAILNSDILEEYQDKLISNKDGCIFKIVNEDSDSFICVEDYVSCKEFTAPPGIIFLPNDIYDNLLLSPDSDTSIDIELFMPPQATKIKFKPSDSDIFTENLKEELEFIITNKYKFLKVDDIITIGNSYVVVQELEPYFICMVNNTDLNVEFDSPAKTFREEDFHNLNHEDMLNNTFSASKEVIMNTDVPETILKQNTEIDTQVDDVKPLSRTELRNKRLAFFNKQ